MNETKWIFTVCAIAIIAIATGGILKDSQKNQLEIQKLKLQQIQAQHDCVCE